MDTVVGIYLLTKIKSQDNGKMFEGFVNLPGGMIN